MSKKDGDSPLYVSEKDRLNKPGATKVPLYLSEKDSKGRKANRKELALLLANTVESLGEFGLLSLKAGRLPVTAYKTRAELILASAAPTCALVEAKMIRGEIPHNESIFRSCDSILDRILGKARQQIDFVANEEGYRRLERLAMVLALARGETPEEVIKGEYKVVEETGSPAITLENEAHQGCDRVVTGL